ncbi:MAG: acetolactate synthase [Clostridia bacterium]|nr:acetolactate synthase [Clostridia bacterium]
MAVKQISIFLENKQGTISDVTDLLAKNGVDLRALCLADTKTFGILRIIAEDTERAAAIIKEAGQTFNVREVVCFFVPDEAGGLAKVLRILDDGGVNIEYMYAVIANKADHASIVARVDDNEKTEALLRGAGIEVL